MGKSGGLAHAATYRPYQPSLQRTYVHGLGRLKLLSIGHKKRMAGILWTIISVLFILWLLGFLLHFGGGLIHLILLVVVVLVVINLLTGRGARV